MKKTKYAKLRRYYTPKLPKSQFEIEELNFVLHFMLAGVLQIGKRWIAKVTSSLHDLLPVSQQSCKTKFRESSVTPESRKLILQTLLKPEFTLTKDLNIASGYVSMNIDRTPTVKMGMPNGGRSCFAKFAKVTSTSGFGYIPNGGSCFFTS